MPPLYPQLLDAFTGKVVPILQDRGLFRTEYAGTTLRDHYGLPRPESQYAAQRPSPSASSSRGSSSDVKVLSICADSTATFASLDARRTAAGSEPRVDRLGLEARTAKTASCTRHSGSPAANAVQRLQAEGVLAQGERALAAEVALAQPVEAVGVVRAVDDPQVLPAAHLMPGCTRRRRPRCATA